MAPPPQPMQPPIMQQPAQPPIMQQPIMQQQQPSSLVPAQQQQQQQQQQWDLFQAPPQAPPPQPQQVVQQQQQQQLVPAAAQQQPPQNLFDPFAGGAPPAAAAVAPMPAAMPPVQAAFGQQPQQSLVAAPAPINSSDPFGMFAAPAPAQPPVDIFGASAGSSSGGGLRREDSFASSLTGSSGAADGNAMRAGGGGIFGITATEAVAAPWLDVSDLQAAGSSESAGSVAGSAAAAPPLPADGEYYQVDVSDRLLGIVMYKPAAAAACGILSRHPPATIQQLGPTRPVVAHLNGNSAARTAGVALGDILTAINGKEVRDRVEAGNLLRSMPRPVTLQMFRLPSPGHAPPATLHQGTVLVHYKNRDTLPPLKPREWKAKFVVVGGILGGGAGSKIVTMYRSRAEYDRAVTDVHSGRKVSVKVKQFSLDGGAQLWYKEGQGSKGRGGPNSPAASGGPGGWSPPNLGDGMEQLKYPAEASSRQYVQILMPKPANHIKLSVPLNQTEQLRPILDGIRLALYMYTR